MTGRRSHGAAGAVWLPESDAGSSFSYTHLPDYGRPPVDTPTAWRLSEKDARDLANTLWWEQLGDPVLNDLVTTALRENKDLLIAAARVDQFAGNYGIVRSGLFPQPLSLIHI